MCNMKKPNLWGVKLKKRIGCLFFASEILILAMGVVVNQVGLCNTTSIPKWFPKFFGGKIEFFFFCQLAQPLLFSFLPPQTAQQAMHPHKLNSHVSVSHKTMPSEKNKKKPSTQYE